MKIHLNETHFGKRPSKVSRTRFGDEVAVKEENYSTIFRELFCVAALELSNKLREKLENLGVLYGDIMMTGITSMSMGTLISKKQGSVDIELGTMGVPLILGRGQLLFLVRRADLSEAARLKAYGFRFARIDHVMDHLASSTQTNRTEIEPRIRSMLQYVNSDSYLTPGIYLSCCAIRARPRGHWDILTCKSRPAQLPSIPLCTEWTRMHRSVLSTMDGWTMITCLRWLKYKTDFSSATERDFVRKLCFAMEYLANTIADSWINDAVLSANTIAAPCSSQNDTALLIVFRKLVDVHARASSAQLVFSPLDFFRTQQRVVPGCHDHKVFARDTRGEFIRWLRRHSSFSSLSPSLPSIPTPAVTAPPRARRSKPILSWVCPNAIFVRSEVSVDVRRIEKGRSMEVEEVELDDFKYTECGVGEEQPTFVDDIFHMLVEGR